MNHHIETRVLNGASLARASERGAAAPPRRPPATLRELQSYLAAVEGLDNPDVVLPFAELRMTDADTVAIPGVGDFALTGWARRQLSTQLGIRWEKWFATLSPGEQADEVNKRLARSPGKVRLRTTRGDGSEEQAGVAGSLRAFVSDGYRAVADSLMAQMLGDVIGTSARGVRRVEITDMTVSYVVDVGGPFNPGDAKVGDLRGGLMVRNSGVGFSRLVVTAHLERLVCTNGMVAPVRDPVILAHVHRGAIGEEKIRHTLAERARNIGGQLTGGAQRLLEARRIEVPDLRAAFVDVMRQARIPQKHLPQLEAAYAKEPEATAFGIVQAVTLAAQQFPPEQRFELERAASAYITDGSTID